MFLHTHPTLFQLERAETRMTNLYTLSFKGEIKEGYDRIIEKSGQNILQLSVGAMQSLIPLKKDTALTWQKDMRLKEGRPDVRDGRCIIRARNDCVDAFVAISTQLNFPIYSGTNMTGVYAISPGVETYCRHAYIHRSQQGTLKIVRLRFDPNQNVGEVGYVFDVNLHAIGVKWDGHTVKTFKPDGKEMAEHFVVKAIDKSQSFKSLDATKRRLRSMGFAALWPEELEERMHKLVAMKNGR